MPFKFPCLHLFAAWWFQLFNCCYCILEMMNIGDFPLFCVVWLNTFSHLVISGFRQFSCFILKLSPHANAWESSSSRSKERSATLLGCDGGFCSPLQINSPMECSSNFPIIHDLSSPLLMKSQDFLVVQPFLMVKPQGSQLFLLRPTWDLPCRKSNV